MKVVKNLTSFESEFQKYAVKIKFYVGSCILLLKIDSDENYDFELYGVNKNTLFDLFMQTLKFLIKFCPK